MTTKKSKNPFPSKIEGVQRYAGQPIPPLSRICVIVNDALGNYVIATPLLKKLREVHKPARLDLFTGNRVKEFCEASPLADRTFYYLGTNTSDVLGEAREVFATYDWVFNLENSPLAMTLAAALAGESGFVSGPCAGLEGRGVLPHPDDPRGKLWEDEHWANEDTPKRFHFLQSGFIAEIFCRLAYLEGPIPPYDLPRKPVEADLPEVWISASASLPEKIWPQEKWETVLQTILSSGLRVGVLGAKPASQKAYWLGADMEEEWVQKGLVEDWRGEFTLPEVVDAIAQAKAVLTLDTGIMHIACVTQTPTLALFRHEIVNLWKPPAPNLHALAPEPGQPVASIPVRAVLECFDRSVLKASSSLGTLGSVRT